MIEKFRVLKDYHFQTPEKQIIIIKSGTVISDYKHTYKEIEYTLDRELLLNNPDFFIEMDILQDIVYFLKSNKVEKPSVFGKKFLPFVENIINSYEDKLNNYSNIIIDNDEIGSLRERLALSDKENKESENKLKEIFHQKEMGYIGRINKFTEINDDKDLLIKKLNDNNRNLEETIQNLRKDSLIEHSPIIKNENDGSLNIEDKLNTIINLSNVNNEYKEKINRLESTIESLRLELDIRETDIETLQKDIEDKNNSIREFKENNSRLKEEMDMLIKKYKNKEIEDYNNLVNNTNLNRIER